MPVYKKADGKKETQSPLEDVKVFPDHIRGKIGEFRIKFTSDDIVAEVSYKDARIRLYGLNERTGWYSKSREELVVPLVSFSIHFYLPEPSITTGNRLAGETVNPSARVTFDEKDELFSGEVEKYGGFDRRWFSFDKKMVFDAGFSRKLDSDFELFSKSLFLALESDPNLQPFKAEKSMKIERQRRGIEMAVQLADRIEVIAKENDFREKPEALLPVLMKAKEEGVLFQLQNEVFLRELYEVDKSAQWNRLFARIAINKFISENTAESTK